MEQEPFDIAREIDGDDIIATVPFYGDGSTVRLRFLSERELKKIGEKTKQVRKWVNHQQVMELDIDDANRRLGRAAVVGWDFKFHYRGGPLPYSPEACDALINEWGLFSRFVNTSCTDFRKLVEAQREDTKKNSGSMSASA